VVEAFVVVDHLDLFVENYKMNQTKIKMAWKNFVQIYPIKSY
jgi:hypothetical protein